MEFKVSSRIKLNNGIDIPIIGLGTYGMSGKELHKAVESALQAGYYLFDTASSYGNEKETGEAIKNSSISREKIFVTTKLDNSDHGYDEALKAFDLSLKKLGMDYIDLSLIHWPSRGKRKETWKALETLYNKGLCRSIGVSNYTETHLNELFGYASIIPAVNQVEFNPFVYQKDLLNFNQEHNIQLEGYTPLARVRKMNKPEIKNISKKYGKTPAQILLRWSLQHKVVVIPKSSKRKRIEENINFFDFEIADEEMEILDSMDENYRVSPDPKYIE